MLARLESIIGDRARRPKKGSYTHKLFDDPELARSKVLEEACELIMASRGRDRKALAGEAADLSKGASLGDVKAELRRRHR